MFASRSGHFQHLLKSTVSLCYFLQYSYECVQARKLTWGNQRATALSLAAKGSVVAEKRRTRCPLQGRVLIQGTLCSSVTSFTSARFRSKKTSDFVNELSEVRTLWAETSKTKLLPERDLIGPVWILGVHKKFGFINNINILAIWYLVT
jgi:hypothetical protein